MFIVITSKRKKVRKKENVSNGLVLRGTGCPLSGNHSVSFGLISAGCPSPLLSIYSLGKPCCRHLYSTAKRDKDFQGSRIIQGNTIGINERGDYHVSCFQRTNTRCSQRSLGAIRGRTTCRDKHVGIIGWQFIFAFGLQLCRFAHLFSASNTCHTEQCSHRRANCPECISER